MYNYLRNTRNTRNRLKRALDTKKNVFKNNTEKSSFSYSTYIKINYPKNNYTFYIINIIKRTYLYVRRHSEYKGKG